MEITKRDVANIRIDICNTCPNLRPKIHQCKKCGCIMPAKVWFMGASCPEGKWGTAKIGHISIQQRRLATE